MLIEATDPASLYQDHEVTVANDLHIEQAAEEAGTDQARMEYESSYGNADAQDVVDGGRAAAGLEETDADVDGDHDEI